jgi:hypothetical protein
MELSTAVQRKESEQKELATDHCDLRWRPSRINVPYTK